MTFQAFETGIESGQPIELYEFLLGGVTHRFTSNMVDVTVGLNTYDAIPIQRGLLERGGGEKLSVRLPSSTTFVQQFVLFVPGRKMTMTLKRFHRNDPDQQVVTLFVGVVAAISFVNQGREVEMQALPVQSALGRPIPRFTYQNLCNHMLYDARCKILETDPAFRKSLLVTAVSGNLITCQNAGTFGADFFEAGFVTHLGDFRLVTKQTVDVLELLVPFTESPLNQTVLVNAGCKHRISTDCIAKFNNLANFGGFPFVPTKNIFATGLD